MNLSQMNKKLIIVVSALIVFFIIFMMIISSLTKDRTMDFPAIEQRLIQGAEKYYEKNPEILPKENGGKTSVSINTLEDGKYIPRLSSMVKGNVICNAEVRVSNNNGYYLYVPYLNCGTEYVTKELYKIVIGSENIVTIDDGLYKINDEYVFRGSPENNFVQFSGKMWRIIKVDKDNNIKIIENTTKNSNMWDNRYNIDKNNNFGINDFFKSRLEKKLETHFSEIISENNRGFVVAKPFCIGSREENNTSRNGQAECSVLSDPIPLGLISVNEFLMVSLDANCNGTYSRSCQNYNYLAQADFSWWTMTPFAQSSYQVYYIDGSVVSYANCSNSRRLRSVVYLSDDVVSSGGTGTYLDPYIIK